MLARPRDGFQRLLPIAQGGMGYVELVLRREGSFRRLYALKRPQPQFREDAGFRAMFMDEARLSGLVRHPHVVSVLDVGEDADGPYLVMDYVDGVSVATIIQEHGTPLPVELCVQVAAHVARGLHAAHEVAVDGRALGLVHRDISPQNILVGFDGIARVTDFGIAKAFGNTSQTSTGLLKGNVGYLAPELLRFQEPDRRSDLFALGVVLFEMLAGRRLYAGAEVGAVARRILEEPQPDIGELRDDIGPELTRLLFELLAKDRELRPADARQVAERLEDILGEHERFDLAAWMEAHLGARRQQRARDIDKAVALAQGEAKGRPSWSRRAVPLLAAASAVGLVSVATVALRAPEPDPRPLGLFAGTWHTCAVSSTGLACWGKNNEGQLGVGLSTNAMLPVQVKELRDEGAIVSLRGAEYHTCAVSERGRLFCWGSNAHGQLGLPSTSGTRLPMAVPGIADARQVTVADAHSCAVDGRARVFCWGGNEAGQLGLGAVGPPQRAPREVPDLMGVAEVDARGRTTCARLLAGGVRCWGENSDGQLGDGSLQSSPRPVAVKDLTDARQVAVGSHHGCARRASGGVVCWGNNGHGKLGDGGPPRIRPTPAPVPDLSSVVELAVSDHFSCARMDGGRVSCWGRGLWGNLGNGSEGPFAVAVRPVAVLQIADAVSLVAGNQHACVRHRTGAISCWGDGVSGQIGDGTTRRRTEAVSVTGFP